MNAQEQRLHDLIKADMDRGVEEMRRTWEQAFFADPRKVLGLPPAPPYVPPPAWRRWLTTTRGYLWTLWRALRGAELVDPCDYDEY